MHLHITAGPEAGREFELTSTAAVTIGRDEHCQLRLADPSISRAHCRVTLTDGRAVLDDLGSRWGTQVNGKRVEHVELRLGDVITMGDSILTLQSTATETIAPRQRDPQPTGSLAITPVAEPTTPLTKLNEADVRDLTGQIFAGQHVDRIIARAVTGMIYQGIDLKTAEPTALKIYWPSVFADETAQQRFIRAGKTMLPLMHPNLVRLHAAGRSRGVCYTISEWIEGQNVAQIIAKIGIAGMLDWREVWKIGVGITRALVFLHEQACVHRNLKPTNILVRKSDGCVKLGDHIFAKTLDDAGPVLTQAGQTVGDVHYLAPEQIDGSPIIDARADLYSLGATLYALLTGRPPFTGSLKEVLTQIMTKPTPPPSQFCMSIPAQMEGLVVKLLSKRPDDRFENADDLLGQFHTVGWFLGLQPPAPAT